MTIGAVLTVLVTGAWQQVAHGVWQREIQMAERGPLSVVQALVVRVEPGSMRFRLDTATRDYGTRGAWSAADRLTPEAVLAANTGQFIGGVVWGWVVSEGVESSPPGAGTVAMAFVVDSAGVPALLTQAEVPRARGHVRLAFQSYPALLIGEGMVPWELQAPSRGVDLDHRDSRLAIGVLADGSVVIVLTRFTAPGSSGATVPWGPTVVEMADFMRALGCTKAMMLDGGISSQLSLRYTGGELRHWTNWRKVPMGLVVEPRTETTLRQERPR